MALQNEESDLGDLDLSDLGVNEGKNKNRNPYPVIPVTAPGKDFYHE